MTLGRWPLITVAITVVVEHADTELNLHVVKRFYALGEYVCLNADSLTAYKPKNSLRSSCPSVGIFVYTSL